MKSAPSSPRIFFAAKVSAPARFFISGHAAVGKASLFALLRSLWQWRAEKRFAKIDLGRAGPQALSRWSETFDAFLAASEKRSMFSATVWFAVSVAFTVLLTDLSHAS